jgi:hypothetical protein
MDPQEIIRRLNEIYHNVAGESKGVRLTAYNLRELMLRVHAVGQTFVEDPTINTLCRLEARFECTQTYIHVLKNLSSLDQTDVDSVAQDMPDWLLQIPLEDVELRLRHLQEHGE